MQSGEIPVNMIRSNKTKIMLTVTLLVGVSGNPLFSAEAVLQDGSVNSIQTKSDADKWVQLRNRYGWEIRYPADWGATGHGYTKPADDDAPTIGGPKGCYDQRCGNVQIQVETLKPTDKIAKLTACELVRRDLSTGAAVSSTRELEVAGVPACEIIFTSNYTLNRYIAFKYRNQSFLVAYWEDGKASITEIKSPADWKFVEVFDKMMSTFSFTDGK